MKTLKYYENMILSRAVTQKLKKKDWIEIEKEVDQLYRTSTESEIKEFVDSGAGELLDMSLEYL